MSGSRVSATPRCSLNLRIPRLRSTVVVARNLVSQRGNEQRSGKRGISLKPMSATTSWPPSTQRHAPLLLSLSSTSFLPSQNCGQIGDGQHEASLPQLIVP